MQRKLKKVLLTGGHAGATAYAFAQALKKDKTYSWDIYWVGSKKAIEGLSVPTFEEKVLPVLGVKVFTITAGRIQRRFTRYTIPSILKIPIGFIEAFFTLNKIKPDIIISFGGFAAFPVVIIGKILGVVVIIHEQTIVYGRANRASSYFATKIALARPQSLRYFDKSKAVVVGNPISEEILNIAPKKVLGNPPTIFVTGGSRGAENVNAAIEPTLPSLLDKYRIIHQVGTGNEERYKRIKETLGKMGKNYEVYGVLEPVSWSVVMERADLVIGRSGANIVSELLVTKRPAILIPIPWTFMDEQTKNAEYARDFGVATILPQDLLSPQSLLAEVDKTFSNWKKIVEKIGKKESPDREACRKLVSLLKENI